MNASRSTARMRSTAIAVIVGALFAFVAYTVWRETHKSSVAPAVISNASTAHEMGHAERPPMSADEERYAHALWKIHDEVRTSAVKMTFAGMSYKLGDSDKAAMRQKVIPLIGVFTQAHAQVSALTAPQSMGAVHKDYLEALRLYRQAAKEMTRVTKEGDDANLIEAHGVGEKASSLLLKVGEVLWPGEYKPN